MRNQAELLLSVISFLCSLIIIVSFAMRRSRRDSEQVQAAPTTPPANQNSSCCKSISRFLRNTIPQWWKGIFYLFFCARGGRPTFSTAVLFIAIALCFRSAADFCSFVQRSGDLNITLCHLEGILRTYAGISSSLSLSLLALQLYVEKIPPQTDIFTVERWFKALKPLLFNCTKTENYYEIAYKREVPEKYTVLLYHVVFVWPAIFALIPLISSDNYGTNAAGIALCTFSDDTNGMIWSIFFLYWIIIFSWAFMACIYGFVLIRGAPIFSSEEWILSRIMIGFFIVSVVVWLPRFIAVVSNNELLERTWEPMFQAEALMYFGLYYLMLTCTGNSTQVLSSINTLPRTGSISMPNTSYSESLIDTPTQSFRIDQNTQANPINNNNLPSERDSEEVRPSSIGAGLHKTYTVDFD